MNSGGIAKAHQMPSHSHVSFWVRSNTTGTYCVSVRNVTEILRGLSLEPIQSMPLTHGNARGVNFPADTSGATYYRQFHAMSINWVLGAGKQPHVKHLQTSWGSYDSTALATGSTDITGSTSNEWYITGVQLEVGEQATPFEHRSYGDELARCQRYFQIVGNSTYFAGNGVGSATISVGVPLATPMRAEPSVPDTRV